MLWILKFNELEHYQYVNHFPGAGSMKDKQIVTERPEQLLFNSWV